MTESRVRMDTCRCCGAEVIREDPAGSVCPACLLRLAVETGGADAPLSESETPRLLGPIGRGPHGTVHLGYRAHDEPRFVTIKLIEERIDVDRFSERIRAVADRLRSATPAAIPVFLEPGVTAGGQAYVLSAFVTGAPVAHYGAFRRGDPDAALRTAIQVCTLVANLHRAGIVHGSIKSSNVIVSDSREGPVAVLLDTGVGPAIEAARIGPDDELIPDVRRDVLGLEMLVIELLDRAGVQGSGLLEGGCASAADLAERLATLRASRITYPGEALT
jgi:hypothetical protein